MEASSTVKTDTDRKLELAESLQSIGLELRHDSCLCYSYVTGKVADEWTLEKVVRECAMMHWLYNYTDYQARCQGSYMYYRNAFTDGTSLRKYVRTHIQPHIKAEIMLEYGIPEEWPWLGAKI